LRNEGLATEPGLASGAAGSLAFMERRWPSNTVVAQDRSFSIIPAQIFAAAAASLIGPATNLSCMPSPLLLSLMMMIGRNVVNAAFDLDLRSPRHSARKPGSEFAPPTSIPNSVRWTANLGAADAESDSAASSAGEVEATTTSGIGSAVTVFGGALGSINFPAAGSGGAIMDFAATSVGGVTAGPLEAAGALDDAAAGLGSGGGAAAAEFFSAAGAVVAVVVPTADTAGPGGDFWAAAGISGGAAACGAVTVEFCRAIAGAVVAVVAPIGDTPGAGDDF
jgi:hypothetical protein